MYDLIIVGAGPAGITAGVYAVRKRMDFLIISKDIGGQASYSWEVENYTGYQFITGPELVEKFKEHLSQFKVEVRDGEVVTGLRKAGALVEIETDKGRYQSKTAIVASGRRPRNLGAEGEAEFKNRGVTYCATCDGPLFTDRDVAVIGGGNSALDATLQLMKIVNKIYLIDAAPDLRADPVMAQKAKENQRVTIYSSAEVKRIYGEKFVQGMEISVAGKTEDLAVQGIFIEIGSIPSSDFVEGIAKNREGEILVNCQSETNIPGIFAAGDVTDVPAKQIIVACGEGAKATIRAFEYLSKRR